MICSLAPIYILQARHCVSLSGDHFARPPSFFFIILFSVSKSAGRLLQVFMYPASCFLILFLAMPTFALVPTHRRRDEGLVPKDTTSGRAFSLPIHRRRESGKLGRPGRLSRRNGVTGTVGIGDNSDLYAGWSLERRGTLLMLYIQII